MMPVSAEELVDAFLANRKKRIDSWVRDELIFIAKNYAVLGPKACSRFLPGRTFRATEQAARRLEVVPSGRSGRRKLLEAA